MKKLSRSKLELLEDCPRCFWLEVARGLKRPPSFPYTINSSIDHLLKQEFDACRQAKKAHEVMRRFQIDAVPFECEAMDRWRHNFTGVQVPHPATDFLVFGAVDDVWVSPGGELYVVDYKSTGAEEYRIHPSYKRQMEVYQWLLRGNGYRVSDTGYFLFAKVNKPAGFKEGRLTFDLSVEPCAGDASWVEPALFRARKILEGPAPEASQGCLFCAFARGSAEGLGATAETGPA